jgi:glutamyl-tRNA reductase
MRLSVIGISHRVVPVDVRERYSLTGDLSRQMLSDLRAEGIVDEALVVDTCNRTDVYCVTREDVDVREHVLGHIKRLKNIAAEADASFFYQKKGADAVRYLFEVTSSLDSQVVGEYQILGQVKDAYRLAVREGATGFLLGKLMHAAFRVGKRVRTETQLGRDSTSVAQAAVDLARQIFSSLQGRTVLFIGAGKTAQLAARAVIRSGVARVIVANRTLSRAEEAAIDLLSAINAPDSGKGGEGADAADEGRMTCPALVEMSKDISAWYHSAGAGADGAQSGIAVRAITLEEMPGALAEADLVISSTGAPEPVLTVKNAGAVLARRKRPLVIIDIAVPRDVDERLGEFANVFLNNIEDLNRIVANNTERRRQEIPKAEAIVTDEAERFDKWLRSLELTPTIKLLVEHFDELRRKELERYGRNLSGSEANVALFAESLCKKILHSPLACLRELAESGDAGESMAATEMIRRMFNLDSKEKNT